MRPFANDAVLNDLIERIVYFSNPQRVIVFGSFALGTPNPKSDIDILIVKDYLQLKGHRERELLAHLADFPFPLDLTCVTPEELKKEMEDKMSFLYSNLKVGLEVYTAGNNKN
jgi:predicted nucleotidyltransferase